MRDRSWIAAGLASLALVVGASAGTSRGDDHAHKHEKSTTATPHTIRQAGYPQCVSPVSMVSYNEHYSGGYIGGGKAHGGHEPCRNEGTWGWDYTPFRPMSSRIFLKWSHGRHEQGGVGAYATDGPKPLEHITETIHGHFGGPE
jgi:hypothetical protein